MEKRMWKVSKLLFSQLYRTTCTFLLDSLDSHLRKYFRQDFLFSESTNSVFIVIIVIMAVIGVSGMIIK